VTFGNFSYREAYPSSLVEAELMYSTTITTRDMSLVAADDVELVAPFPGSVVDQLHELLKRLEASAQ